MNLTFALNISNFDSEIKWGGGRREKEIGIVGL